MNNQLTFLIPSYRRPDLLIQNLPSILDQALPGDQVIISEDGPFDPENHQVHQQALAGLKKKFLAKKVDFLLLFPPKNLRFGANVNQAVQKVAHPYFFLLNNDVALRPGTRDKLLATIRKDKNIFAVCAQQINDLKDSRSGRNKLWFKQGRFWHSAAMADQTPGPTAWADGGSSIFNTAYFRQLGGFDRRYYPAYWEDIDLSYQAEKNGYKILYQPTALVEHHHQTTNDQVFGQEKIKKMSWRSGSRFTWKNSTFTQKLQFLALYPYWFFRQFPQYRWWLAVLALAILTRCFALGSIPAGLTVDEAAIAYNGYGIFTQRRDEWLNRLPISFRSYGDYKAPLAIYVNGLSTAIFDLQPFAIRLPFAVANILSILFFMLLVQQLWQKKTSQAPIVAAVAGFLLTITPWHLHYGRLGFENNFALLFTLAGTYFFLTQINTTTDRFGRDFTQKWWSWRFLLSGLCFTLSLYSYHSSKVFLPLFLLALAIFFFNYLKKHLRLLLIPLLFSLIVLLPLLQDSFFGQGLTRAGSSFLFDQSVPLIEKTQLFLHGYATHLTPDFLLFGALGPVNELGQANLRHGDNQNGVLNFPLLILIILAIISALIFSKFRQKNSQAYFFALTLAFLGLVPAAITTQIPHSNQALLAAPGFILLATLGLTSLGNCWLHKKPLYSTSLGLLFLVLISLSFIQYQSHYYQVYTNQHFTITRQVNEKLHADRQLASHLFAQNLFTALKDVRALEKDVSQIIVATGFEHEYIYALLARQTKPINYQGGSLSAKYLFLENVNRGDLDRENTLILVTPQHINQPEQFENITPLQTYYDYNGDPNLYLYESLN